MQFTDKKLLIFDLDGTLINSAPDLAVAINHMLTTLDRLPFQEAIIDGWVGNGALTLVKRALSGSREIDEVLPESLVLEALAVFLNYYAENLCHHTKPYPNVPLTLKQLHAKGYHLAIVTNKPFAFVEPILEALGLESLFEMILGGDSLPEKKPNPTPLLHLCKTMGIKVASSVMIGDSRNDMIAAKGCNMQSIGVTYGYNYGEHISVYHPTAIIDDFSELLELL